MMPNAMGVVGNRRSTEDFEFGDVLGEGSYSTVSVDWSRRHNRNWIVSMKTDRLRVCCARLKCSQVTLVTTVHPPYRQYALKVLDKEHIKRERKTKYVLIERDTLKALDGHPGIIKLWWTFQDEWSLCEYRVLLDVAFSGVSTKMHGKIDSRPTIERADYVLEYAENGELLKWIKKVSLCGNHDTSRPPLVLTSVLCVPLAVWIL